MNRADFLKRAGAITLGFASSNLLSFATTERFSTNCKKSDWSNQGAQWKYLGTKDKTTINKDREEKYDVAVIGGGIAGVCAAVAAARHGSKTVLVQNRAMLGGNASSEIHVPINGSYHFKRSKWPIDRETGIVEEIQMENLYYNPQMSWEVWDHVLYGFVKREPNITLMLETHATEAIMDGKKIKKCVCFQQCTESKVTIEAEVFVDCSGDGMMAVSAGAEYRTGREGKAEFNETYSPDIPDGWVMGDSIQFSSKDMGYPVKFHAPDFAIKYDPSKMKDRKISQLNCGFWWIEFGSDFDITVETNQNRDKLLAYLYGAWDYVKNSGKFPEAENLVLDWVGSVPGRRESRRFMGDYILSEGDLTQYKQFDDAIAYAGGWSMDEHCPGGLLNPNDPASFFHQRFSQMTQIPYRTLYSRNIENLMFAGRNYSATHMALSATRLIAMCGMMGQASGTAAAMCVEKGTQPRGIYQNYIKELQERLLRDDIHIPNRPANDSKDFAKKATIKASSTKSGSTKFLVDGYGRDDIDASHHWMSDGLNPDLTLSWNKEVELSSVELKCDSSLHREIQLHPNSGKMAVRHRGMPLELVKKGSVEAKIGGKWVEVASADNNIHRLLKFKFDKVKCSSIRINLKETYGASDVTIFEVRCY